LLLGAFASALLVMATSFINYLLSKKANKESYIYEINKIICWHEGTISNYSSQHQDEYGFLYRSSNVGKIMEYDLKTLKNIVNDYHTIFSHDKSKKIINEIYQEIELYIASISYDVLFQVYNSNFTKFPNLNRVKELLGKSL
jgi:hypothetical protein